MIQLTARIFENGQVVGYRATDGQQEQSLTKQQAWQYAKNHQIINVEASGTMENPGLSGVNGFKIKELPDYKELIKEKIPKTTLSDGTKASEVGTKSDSLVLLNGLYDRNSTKSTIRTGANSFRNSKEYMAQAFEVRPEYTRTLVTIGYRLQWLGTEPLQYTRITVDNEHTEETKIAQPNEIINLSRAEVAHLLKQKQFNCRIKNAVLILKDREIPNTYKELDRCYLKFNTPGVSVEESKLAVNDFESEEIIHKYFTPVRKAHSILRNPEDRVLDYTNMIAYSLNECIIHGYNEEYKANLMRGYSADEYFKSCIKAYMFNKNEGTPIDKTKACRNSLKLKLTRKIAGAEVGKEVLGYEFKNISNEPLTLRLADCTTTLTPGDSIKITVLDSVYMLSDEQFMGMISNAKLALKEYEASKLDKFDTKYALQNLIHVSPNTEQEITRYSNAFKEDAVKMMGDTGKLKQPKNGFSKLIQKYSR